MAAIYNILKHDMVPGHFLLSDEEAAKVLKDLNIKKEQLPKIEEGDPAIKVLKDAEEEMFKKDPSYKKHEIKQGDIIKIIRKSETMEDFVVYRLVVETSLKSVGSGFEGSVSEGANNEL